MAITQLSTPTSPSLGTAVQVYLDRQARTAHPDGKFDRKMRWYPSDTESCTCCATIRNPSAAYPYSLNKHCRSVQHVAAIFDVDAKDLRRAAKVSQTVCTAAQS